MPIEPANKPNIVEIISSQNVVEIVAPNNVVEVIGPSGTTSSAQSPTLVEVVQYANVVEVQAAENTVEVYTTMGLRGLQGIPGPSGKFISSPTPPVDPEDNDTWYNTTNGKTYIFYDLFWVEVGAVGPAGSSVNVTIDSVPPTISDPGADGDLWIVV